MKQKHNRIKLNRYTTGILAFLVVATASVVAVMQHSHTEAAPPVKPAAAVKSQFSFNASAAPGWRKGPKNKTSHVAFHDNGCFVSVEHKTGTIDVASELQKSRDSLTSDGYTLTPGGTQALTIQTTAGQQQYELHQYTVTTPAGATKLMGGQEFGYLQLSSGYLKIMGHCETAGQLPTTIPALQAMKFDETN